jgi:hypothetical protein
LHANLVASRDEVIRCHHFDILLTLELRQVVDDVFTTERLPDRQVMDHEALCDHVKDGLSNIEHLLLTYLDLLLGSPRILFLIIIFIVIFFFSLLSISHLLLL